MSGGSEVWINASDWRRAAAVVREQNIREGEERRWRGSRLWVFGRRVIFLRLKDEPLGPNPSARKLRQKCQTTSLPSGRLSLQFCCEGRRRYSGRSGPRKLKSGCDLLDGGGASVKATKFCNKHHSGHRPV